MLIDDFLQLLIGAIVWVVANVVYLDMKRKGLRGFTRFAAFWVGNPTTWITLFAVREGTQPAFDRPKGDDHRALLAEIRADRAARGAEAGAVASSSVGEDGVPEVEGGGPGSSRLDEAADDTERPRPPERGGDRTDE